MQSNEGNIGKATSVGNYLNLYLGQNQGVRLGESVVVSRKAHAKMLEKRIKGQIKILINCDAGKTYLDYVDADLIVHIDVYHYPVEINPVDIATILFYHLDKHFLEEDPMLKYAEDERFRMIADYLNKIFIATDQGQGTVYDLFQGEKQPLFAGDEGTDHVHILARLNRDEYKLIYIIATAAEEAIIQSGGSLARVRNISHGKQKQTEENFAGYIKLPWKSFKGQHTSPLPAKENVNQLVLKLAEKFGGVKEVEEFMECNSTNFLKRKGIDQQKKKWGEVDHYIDQMEDLGLIKKTPAGHKLTKKGIWFKEYLIQHQCELETEIRKNIRKVPGGRSSRFKKLGKVEHTASQIEFINYNKTLQSNNGTWTGNLAVPQTIIQAKKNGFIRGDQHFSIQKGDLHYFDKKSYFPVDICLLMDASGSMAGEKRQAACYLAQHLLLTGKEKVAVVTFQEHSSRIAVPFTRSQSLLNKGLISILPAGLTPMADGIMTAMNLIGENRLKNPLLILITDGVPNTPLWTTDARTDAITAAGKLVDKKIRFICIGVESNKIYLEKLCNKAQGALYLVDDLNKENLINIVRCERKAIRLHNMA
ncbi:MAG: VWA domain-containing protein [Bacillota bacterium]|nr:VWA domain-containing protein [Bacillota bacterium]